VELIEGYADVDDLDAFLDVLTQIGAEHDCVVQAFDARYVAGDAHLEHALEAARRARSRGEAIARDPAVELLCYAAGTRQIDDALALGVSTGRSPVVVLIAALGADADGEAGGSNANEAAAVEAVRERIEPADLERGTELGDPERLREYFEIGDAELAASDADLATLVRERVALLAVER
jgi:KEOPS complex subunit Cgi121